MPSQDKLIKQGILLTDNLFDEIAKRLSRGVKASDTLEAFLNQTKEYTTNNPLVLNGYKDKMLELILQETNNHKFSRPAQRELTRATIEKRVGDRIVDVGEDIVQSVRDIVKWGYNNNKSQDEIADEITHRVDVIKNTRARTIARTEVARTATASDYVINKERGATHFTVDCRDTCCPVCRKDYNFGKVEYTIDQVEMLPPRHPNCYDRETKVYTINGWKYFKDLSDDDLLLSMNPKGNELEFIKPIRLIKYKNTDKKLYHIHNRWFDVCVTEDHDCFIHQRRDGGSKGRYLEPQFRKPSELTSESKFIRCIDVDRENPKVVNINGLEFEPKDFAFFMAWFISEGSVLHNPETAKQHGYPVKITQEIGENREVLERELQRIFSYLGFRVAIGKSYFEVYSKQLYDYLLPLGYSNEKYIPSEVFTLNKECLNIFLDNYVLGDGHERVSDNELVQNSSERALFTSSPRLRDDLSYLVLLCGYYPSISLHTPKGKVSAHKNGTYVQNNTVFRIAVNKSKHTNYSGCTVDLIEYNDYVYCAELPKWHTLWVMRNGKTSWNGNCRCYARYSIKGGSGVKARKTPYSVQTSTKGNTSTQTKLTDEFLQERLSEEDYRNYRMAVYNRSFSQSLLDGNRLDERGIQLHKQSVKEYTNLINELESKALSNSSNAKSVETTSVETTGYQLNNRKDSFSNVVITQEQFDKVVEHQSKRANASREWGNSIDNETGELIHSKDIKGQKYRVFIPKHNKPYSIVHNHINNNGFSGGDAFGHTEGNLQEVCYATTPKGIWIMRDTEFGKFRKQDSVDGDSDLKSRMQSKYKEFSDESKAKYQDQYDNAKTATEKQKIQKQLADEVTENYNNWLLEEFAVGKNRANTIEIEFIPIEEINNVQF